jgi:hypothetical protein
MPKEPKPDDVTFHEVTDRADSADARNFYKVEKWTRDGTKVDSLLNAGNSPDRAREIFTRATKHRPRIRLTIRQRTRASDEWPRDQTCSDAARLRAPAGLLSATIVASRRDNKVAEIAVQVCAERAATKINPGQFTLPGLLQVDASICGLL